MEKHKVSDSGLPCRFTSDAFTQTIGEEDISSVTSIDSKSNSELKDTVCQHSKPARKCLFETYLEKCRRLEKENLEVKKKLKRMEKYSVYCKTELQRFVKRFKEFKNINKGLDSKNKQLLNKNQQMRQRIAEVLKQHTQSGDLERSTKCCEHQEKQKLKEAVVVPRERLKEPQKLKQDSEKSEERNIVTQLKQENQTLRDRLDHNSQHIKDAESSAERVQQELDELESCLLTMQTERNLLRQEVKRLHKEYISLTNSISLQLKKNNKAAGLTGNPLRAMLYSPQQQNPQVKYPVGADSTQQIKVQFEEHIKRKEN